MSVFLIVLFMVAIGALIGGITNSIAIKMLFRPYQAVYVGKRRLPFTPGLIPKRRAELAEQLGNLVVNHLLTAEGLKRKLESTTFLNEMSEWLAIEVEKLTYSDERLASLLNKWLGIEIGQNYVEDKMDRWITLRSEMILAELGPRAIKDVLPKKVSEQIDQYIPKVTALVIQRSINYVKSDEGIERISNMIDRFLASRGTLGNMISMFLGNDRLVDKVQPEIIKMLEDEGTHQLVKVFIETEWQKLKELKVKDVEAKFNIEEVICFIQEKVKENIPLSYLEKPFQEWLPQFENVIIVEMVPKLVKKIGQTVAEELVHVLKKLHLEEVVKNQVEQFSVERLEEMVLSISKRELKLITYLGALLGGLIGLFQGVIVTFLN